MPSKSLHSRKTVGFRALSTAASYLLARPGLLQNLYGECLEALVHPLGTLVDVGDHNPDGLSHRHAFGHANIEVGAAKIENRLNNSATQTLAKGLAVFP